MRTAMVQASESASVQLYTEEHTYECVESVAQMPTGRTQTLMERFLLAASFVTHTMRYARYLKIAQTNRHRQLSLNQKHISQSKHIRTAANVTSEHRELSFS